MTTTPRASRRARARRRPPWSRRRRHRRGLRGTPSARRRPAPSFSGSRWATGGEGPAESPAERRSPSNLPQIASLL
jgi:hypothetical protein